MKSTPFIVTPLKTEKKGVIIKKVIYYDYREGFSNMFVSTLGQNMAYL
jgi:hypothetical protein